MMTTHSKLGYRVERYAIIQLDGGVSGGRGAKGGEDGDDVPASPGHWGKEDLGFSCRRHDSGRSVRKCAV